MASIEDAIVFAVYIPPQAPAPGHAFRTTSNLCSSENRLLVYAPAEKRLLAHGPVEVPMPASYSLHSRFIYKKM